MQETTSVYLYYDRADVLIYVGITKRGMARNVEHNLRRPWWQHVARQEVEHFSTRGAAHRREIELIEAFSPPFNVQHNRQHHEMLAAYLNVVASTDVGADPAKLFTELGGKLPLRVISGYSGDGNITFFSEAVHVSIAVRLSHRAGVRLSQDGGVVLGRVSGITQRGPFVVISGQIRRGVQIESARASLRCVTGKLGPSFELRSVKLLGVDAVGAA